MRIESLVLFLSVAQHRSISRAARQNFISQQGASSVIKGLESEFGVALFNRTPAGLQLTQAGSALAQEAANLVNSYRRMQMLASLNGDYSNNEPLTIVTMPFITNRLEVLFSEYESITGAGCLRIIERSFFDIVSHYAEEDIGALYLIALPAFMICVAKRLENDFEPWITCELMIACSRTSAFAQREAFSRAQLARTPIACYNEEFLNRLLRHLVGSENPNIQMRTSNPALIGRAVSRGDMVTFTDSLSVFLDKGDTSTATLPIEDGVTFSIGALGAIPEQGPAARFAQFCMRYFSTICAPYMEKHGAGARKSQ